MASAAGSAIWIPARPLLSRWSQADFTISGPKLVHFATQNKSFWSIQLHSTPSRLQVSCAAKPKTVKKVCEIVMKQLALPDDSVVTGESKFSALGADPLDKLVQVEIVMGLEDAFGISVEEDVAQGITTVQDAADMIDKIIEGKSGASSETRLGISSQSVVGENDLLIVGPGVLGRIVAEKWQQDHPNCRVFGQTITTDHHDELTKVGIIPFLRGTIADHQFPFIIFCAPPSRAADYPGDVRLASSYWNGEGSFLFTSSSAVYDCNDNGVCDEDAPVIQIGKSPRTDVLLRAENAVLEVGGSVLRLAGLYKSDRGAHVYWLKKGTVDIRPDHVLNLIHYEDAASLSVAIMKKRFRNRVFMGCDNHPLSRQEVMDCVRRSGKFSEKFEGFTGTGGPLGKRMNNSRTRAEVSWEPKYASFPRFLGLEDPLSLISS